MLANVQLSHAGSMSHVVHDLLQPSGLEMHANVHLSHDGSISHVVHIVCYSHLATPYIV